ncbi:carbohydrate sulfotransferase 8-like isoform X2 [Corticium candelabrum]|nr:carbohydrate sulfotransferase 8-like isoform X2 [Corticium candelabrum]
MGLWKKPLTMTETRILHYNMLVDDKHRILYCFLPKAACTSWKKVFQVLTGKAKSTKEISGKNAHDQKRLTFLKDFSSSEALKRLSGYRKMMVHREPMMRFISAYISKFVVPDWYFVKKFGTQILKLYRKDASKESLATGKGVRFEEFSRYIADNAHKALHFDGHWKPAAFQCQPCYVDYDYVSSTDTADEDADVILDLIGANGKVTFPHDNKSRHTSVIQQYFSKLSRAVVKKLIEVYRRDFTLFGYKRPNVKDLVYHNASLSIR